MRAAWISIPVLLTLFGPAHVIWASDLTVHGGLDKAIGSKTVTYDFARQMEGAKQIKCSEFASEMIKHMG